MKSYTVIYRTTYYPQNNASYIESFILQHIRDRIKITDLPEHNYRNIFLLSTLFEASTLIRHFIKKQTKT